MKNTKIYIEENFNPLLEELEKLIKNQKGYEVAKSPLSATIIISFAYGNDEDVLKMSFMGKMIFEDGWENKKIIFLSWFHPWDDLVYYDSLFSPESQTCVLLDTDRYRLLQLPVIQKEIIETINSFSKT